MNFIFSFDRAPANDPNRTVLSWHYYCWIIQKNPLKNNTYPVLDRIVCDELQRKISFATVKLDRMAIGGGSFLTEFGVCAFGTSNGTLDTTECEYILDIADQYFTSWTYWDSNFYDDSGNPLEAIISKFSRVYPQATAGVPVNMYFNATTKIFIYEFTPDSTIAAPTEIFVPAHVYPNGFLVSASDQLNWTYDKQSSVILVTLASESTELVNAKIMIQPQQQYHRNIHN